MNFNKNSKYFRLWKVFLIPVFAFVVIHFLKDIIQDLLGISTILDVFGDAREDLSRFSEPFIWFYHWFMVNTIFLEIFLLIYVPKTWRRKSFTREDIAVLSAIVYLIIAFTSSILLDPRY